MIVPSKDYGRQYSALWPEIQAALEACLLDDRPILGDAVSRFETAFATHQEVRHVIGVGSGTAAATLLYRALDIGPGDAVLTCARTFPGVVSAIVLAGAEPVLFDCEPNGSVCPRRLEAAVTPNTKAVMLVHLYGHAEAADAVLEVCKRRGLMLLEDIAQAHGARWRERRVGGFGRASITSFHPSKNLGAFGDAGAILTNDDTLAAKLRTLRNLGKASKYTFDTLGPNSKLDTLQAAILEVKLRHLDRWTERRAALAHRYLTELAELPDITLPHPQPDSTSVWHLFTIGCSDRDGLRASLTAAGVRAGLHYPMAPHQQAGLMPYLSDSQLPHAEAWAATTLTLPLSPELTDDEIGRVIAAVKRWAQ